jgi:coenzyme F420-reducing hydrogenase beta subunit
MQKKVLVKLNKKYDVGLLGVWFGYNYGSQLTYYSLHETLKSFGLSVLMISKPNAPITDKEMLNAKNMAFVKESYTISDSYNVDTFSQLNDLCDTFVIGSDQVWHKNMRTSFGNSYFLDFADEKKRKISYAASFGHDNVTFSSNEERDILSRLLKRFDAISVREDDGVRICNKVYGIPATQVLDPILLSEKSLFLNFAKGSTLNETSPFILSYILDPTLEKHDAISHLSKELGCRLINVLDGRMWLFKENKATLDLDGTLSNIHAEDLAYLFSQCEFVITDSFHGTCLAVYFEKPFISIANEMRGISRFNSLFKVIGLNDRLVFDVKTILTNKKLLEPVNFEKTNGVLAAERKKSLSWFKKALFAPRWQMNIQKYFVKLPSNDKITSVMAIDETVGVVGPKRCTGCASCANVCSKNAIKMSLNGDGFYNPEIDPELCVKCGLCERICPAIHPVYNNAAGPKCYAVMAKDEVRARSSSGGAFEILAKITFDKGGAVCGVDYKKDFTTAHVIIEKYEELHRLQGSKYTQSDVGLVYRSIRSLLNDGRQVLFSGCPCQVAGLYAYLGNSKLYDSLVTVDLLCHGIPSVKAAKKYFDFISNGREISSLKYKSKKYYGWRANVDADFTDGTNYRKPADADPFFCGYLNGGGVNKNLPCTDCAFNKLPRQGDITIGDFWGISKYKAELNDGKGTSVVLVNNKKGASVFKELKTSHLLKIWESVPISVASAGNPVVTRSYRLHPGRARFFSELDTVPYNTLVGSCLALPTAAPPAAVSSANTQKYDSPTTPLICYDQNKSLLSEIAAIGALGGNIFDYFVDKEIRAVSIYGHDRLLTMSWTQGYYLGVNVKYLIGDGDYKFNFDYPREGQMDIVNAERLKDIPEKFPLIIATNLVTKYSEEYKKQSDAYTFRQLCLYSHEKRGLLDKLVDWQVTHPNSRIVICDMPRVNGVKNLTDLERRIVWNGASTEEPKVFDALFTKYGYSREYYNEVMPMFYTTNRNGVYFMADASGKYRNCVNGYRITTDLPQNSSKRVFVFGNSLCSGCGADDENTLESALQRELNTHYDGSSPYAVVNCANGGALNVVAQYNSFLYHALQDGDIAVFAMNFSKFAREMYKDKLIWCDLQPYFDRPNDLGAVFIDRNNHLNAAGYCHAGKALMNELKKRKVLSDLSEFTHKDNTSVPSEKAKSNISLSQEELVQLDTFVSDLSKYSGLAKGKVGAIVMNCNPFTLGHRYLIEQSASKVDRLFIFVVEEDKSVFPFADRLRLVTEGTADLPNVTVLPSGKFIISQTTFQAYFKKDERKDVVIDPSGDVGIFAEKIAPALNISVRFVGEEPLDNVTRQYNATMARILPQWGIEFSVIPRKETGGAPISASRVRAFLKKKDFDGIAKIVPPTTLTYLKERENSRAERNE